MNLVIVESPAKAKTIAKYLNNEYEVIATMGHISKLKTTGPEGLGINYENFTGNYSLDSKNQQIKKITNLSQKAKQIYLACDPDREGEAIAFHVKNLILQKNIDAVIFRSKFNEITKEAIIQEIENPDEFDTYLYDAQEARRLMDRLIGFRLSKILKKTISGESAGRVQSVCVKLIIERDNEIKNFQKQTYYELAIKDKKNILFNYEYNLQKINEAEAKKVVDEVDLNNLKVVNIQEIEKKIKPSPPLITSSLTILAYQNYQFSTKKTMRILQKLYEGVELKEGSTGLITYMRTDSRRFNAQFTNSLKNLIKKKYGTKYVNEKAYYTNKNSAQDAHEAIRPTNLNYEPLQIKNYLTDDEYKMYNLIYTKTIQSYMALKINKIKKTTISDGQYNFINSESQNIFPGWSKLSEQNLNIETSDYKINELIVDAKLIFEKKHTEPPAHYNEASLIKELEKKEIGRPSTYAQIFDTVIKRMYVKREKKHLISTEFGVKSINILEKYFPEFLNYEYTANIEIQFDQIADGKVNKYKFLKTFYNDFTAQYNKLKLTKEVNLVNEKCPLCQSELVYRGHEKKRFIGCQAFPKCKFTKPDPEKIHDVCPKCKSGYLIKRKNKRGQYFYGCSTYPNCNHLQNKV